MTHEWKWDGRVSIMSGTQLIAVIGTDGGPDAIEERARLLEVAPELMDLAECLRAVCARIIEQYGPVQCGVDFASLGGSANRVLARASGEHL